MSENDSVPSLQIRVSQTLNETMRRVAANQAYTPAEKKRLEDAVGDMEVANKAECDKWEAAHGPVTLDEGGQNTKYERERALNRQRYKLIKEDLDQLYAVLEGESFPVDHDAGEKCDAFAAFSNDVLTLMRDEDMVTLIKTRTTEAPHSFDPMVWQSKVSELPLLNMKWDALYQVQWDRLQKDLSAFLLNKHHKLTRHDYTNKRKHEAVEVNPDEVTLVRDGLTTPQIKTFHRVKDYVRYDGTTGVMYLVANHTPDGLGRYTCRRILTNPKTMKAVFTKYWHDNAVGSHRRAKTLHERLRTMFIGLSRKKIEELIVATDLDHIQRDTGTFRKVVQPLQSSWPMEHVQIDLFSVNRTTQYANLVDHATKYCVCRKVASKAPEDIIDFCDETFSIYGYPVILQTDNGGEFNNPEFKLYCINNNILWRSSRAYKPTTQGAIERLNRTLKSAVYQDWVLTQTMGERQFRDVVNTYNRCVHATTGFTPYELMFGRKEVFHREIVVGAPDRLMEWATRHGLYDKFRAANPDIPHEWVLANLRLIAADDRLLMHYYGKLTGLPVVVKPPKRLLEDKPSSMFIGDNVWVRYDAKRPRTWGGLPFDELAEPPPPKERPPRKIGEESIETSATFHGAPKHETRERGDWKTAKARQFLGTPVKSKKSK